MQDQICQNRITESLQKRETERQEDLEKKRNEKKLANAEHEQYDFFNKEFQEKYKELNEELNLTSSLKKCDVALQLDKISKEIHLLQKFITDSVLFLRGYDIRVCQRHLQDLEARMRKLEEELLPKKRFGFKNKPTVKVKNRVTQNGVDDVDGEVIGNNKKVINIAENFLGFKNLNNVKDLTLESSSIYKKDVTLENLTNCTVFFPGSPSTLQLSLIKDCILLCGPVSTSIFAENCTNCKLIIACQQLRLHSSQSCEIYLHVTSKAIIEDCTDIKVAPYNLVYDSLDADFEKASLDKTLNHWDSLDDFNWLVADKHSPNWFILEESKRIESWEEFLKL